MHIVMSKVILSSGQNRHFNRAALSSTQAKAALLHDSLANETNIGHKNKQKEL